MALRALVEPEYALAGLLGILVQVLPVLCFAPLRPPVVYGFVPDGCPEGRDQGPFRRFSRWRGPAVAVRRPLGVAPSLAASSAPLVACDLCMLYLLGWHACLN